jgi:hypothetical protein
MYADDPRHGTYAGYEAGCKEPCCKAASAEYRRKLAAKHYLTGYQRLDATGTIRRIEALVALGYTWENLDDYLGRQHGTMSRRHHQWVTKGTRVNRPGAAQMAAMYDALSMKVPPDTYGSRRAKTRARRNGWLPPLAWDDDRIDDPTYRPSVSAVRPPRHRRNLLAEVAHLRSLGVSTHAAAQQLGVTVEAIERAEMRANRKAS